MQSSCSLLICIIFNFWRWRIIMSLLCPSEISCFWGVTSKNTIDAWQDIIWTLLITCWNIQHLIQIFYIITFSEKGWIWLITLSMVAKRCTLLPKIMFYLHWKPKKWRKNSYCASSYSSLEDENLTYGIEHLNLNYSESDSDSELKKFHSGMSPTDNNINSEINCNNERNVLTNILKPIKRAKSEINISHPFYSVLWTP